ncbi:sensor domain-containing diguanylate cyclase [Massilia sp. P8910]|uniref:sensor domain-containing diguanylate cyclase n=1 Tax=Massilia antarctica TaxID=2765360 RepID=UPI001E56C3F9|nr:sensor domain-containing diguanylate cyclase [Massilia antarctica]MCE3607974.1 sensor domain-containing diguanylate cyclase [Massilia antarctica]
MGHAAAPGQGMLESVLGAINLGTIVLDHAQRVVVWNRWMSQYSDLPAERVVGEDFFVLFPELSGKRIDSAVRQALRDNFPSVLSQTLHKAPFELFVNAAAREAGERMQQAVAVTPLEVPGLARHCLIQITDVSVAVHRERLLRDQALELRSQTFSDGLTGIANRRHFDVAMDKEMRRAKRSGTPLSLLMIDIDFFKPYNDHYGHQQGDDTLIKVAHALAAMLQRPGDLIARYGGEEFAVILPEMTAEHSQVLAEKMRERIAALALPHAKADLTGYVTVSIGLATHALENSSDIAVLLGEADRALYMAKGAGRNRVVRYSTP